MFLGLVEMTFGLVYASFSLPEWQALKMTFLWTLMLKGPPIIPAMEWRFLAVYDTFDHFPYCD